MEGRKEERRKEVKKGDRQEGLIKRTCGSLFCVRGVQQKIK